MYYGDRLVYRIVVISLAAVLLAAVLGAMLNGRETPQALVALGSGALGALAGMLASSPGPRRR